MIIFELSIIAALPVIVSVMLLSLSKNEIIASINDKYKQIAIGIIFGLLAIIGTELGVPIEGATLNARDAAPLCAGLIFGPYAGIIAGVIGGVERWFAVMWGAGMYTRAACTVSTIIAGLLGAVLKRFMFDNKLPSWYYSFAIGLVAEVIHMSMIFVTHMNDVTTAFSVVRIATIPMVAVNSCAVGLAVFVVNIMDRENLYDKRGERITLSKQFQKGLLFAIVVAYLFTSGFNYILQNRIATTEAVNLLSVNIKDVKDNINKVSDDNLLDVTRTIKNKILKVALPTNEYLVELAEQYDVSEINVVDSSGFISNSTNEAYLGYNMANGEQSRAFLVLNEWTSEFVQDFQPKSFDSTQGMKYAGIAIKNGFVQVGYDNNRFQKEIKNEVVSAANNRHVGETGGVVIVDSYWNIQSGQEEYLNRNLLDIGLYINLDKDIPNKVYKEDICGVPSYYMFEQTEGYIIVTYVSTDEIDFSKYITLYINSFTETIVFAFLFIIVFFVCKYNVVKNVQQVNNSLNKIAEGDLDEEINIHSNAEFDSISNGINKTVESMKNLIAEASARIDQELQYAAEIQFSALPSVFPPFPNRDEFDIYASMRPAKEVGGDFYDFYFINDNILAFLVSDVSGKGIPASLFMMRSKSIMKSLAESGVPVADIFTETNNQLCEGNKAGMFVTSWMGFLNLETGELKFANAGHNPPLVRRKDGEFEYLKSKVGFVLGGMEGLIYKEQSITLQPGDEIYLYTDGVVEATSAEQELYGDDRLKKALDHYRYEDVKKMCESITDSVDAFVGEAPQFDDMTMLSLKFHKYANK